MVVVVKKTKKQKGKMGEGGRGEKGKREGERCFVEFLFFVQKNIRGDSLKGGKERKRKKGGEGEERRGAVL